MKFSLDDKVISIKRTTQQPEGFIGVVQGTNSQLFGGKYPITVVSDRGAIGQFKEDELELLSSSLETAPIEEAKTLSALDKQIGGGHYKSKGIQPIEYIFANSLGFCESNIVKYATRWKDKNGIQDLEKIIHYAELLIELTKKEESKNKEGK